MESCSEKYCQCLYYLSNALSRAMSKKADAAFAPLGLSSSYAILLMTVNDNPGILPKELSQIMQLAPSTLTRFIEKMENKDLLKRQQVGRTMEIYPTELCLSMQDQLLQTWKDLEKEYNTILGDKNGTQLVKDLQETLQKLSE